MALGPEERMLGATAPETTSPSGDYTLAMELTPLAAGRVTHIRYWHPAGHTAGHGHILSLWKAADGTELGRIVDLPPVAATGFREALLPEPVELDAGTPYRVSYSTHNYSNVHSTTMPASLAPSLALSSSSYYALAADTFPQTAQANTNRFVDVVFRSGAPDPIGPSGGGGALSSARNELADLLTAEGIEVRASASTGHMSPPAAIITPGPEWVIANAQLGSQLHGRVQLTVTLIVGKVAAGASLAALEELLEVALPALIPRKWILAAIGQPFGITIAGTEYLAADATITRSLILN